MVCIFLGRLPISSERYVSIHAKSSLNILPRSSKPFLLRNHRENPSAYSSSRFKASSQTPSNVEDVPQLQIDNNVHEEFSCWTKQWYCIGITIDFDTHRPNPVTLLNNKLVVWFSPADNQWHCFNDRCPHRAASLSEGKIWGDGTLYCSYHGWRFDSSGSCKVIPQAATQKAESSACTNPKSCAASYPIKNIQGKLFVWAESGADAVAEADRVPVPIDIFQAQAENDGMQLLQAMPPYARILPYDYQTLVENLIDPAHVPFAHHGLAGNRNRVKYGDEETRRIETPPGSVFKVARRAPTSKVFDPEASLHLEFIPPSLIMYYQQKPDGTFFSFPTWCTPISPGKSLLVTHQTTNYTDIPTFLKIISKLPRWADHLFLRLKVVDGDTILLVEQERLQLKEDSMNASSPAWRRLFYMPTSSDVCVVAFRTWLDGAAAKGGPFGPLYKMYDGLEAASKSRKELLERFNSHTEKCSSCKTVYHRVQWLLSITKALSNILWSAVVSLSLLSINNVLKGNAAPIAVSVPIALSAVLSAVIATVAARILKNLKDQFLFVDYRHADIE